jgi:hypothetical protein
VKPEAGWADGQPMSVPRRRFPLFQPRAASSRIASVAAILLLGCSAPAPAPVAPPAAAFISSPLWPAESAYQDLRYLSDQIGITRDRGASESIHGVPLTRLIGDYRAAQAGFRARLDPVDTATLSAEDRRAWRAMQESWAGRLGVDPESTGTVGDSTAPDCTYDPQSLAAAGLEGLTARLYACYSRAAQAIPFEGQVLGRLTILGLLGETTDPDRRRRLFLALEPVWRTVNRDDGPDSPYRALVRTTARQWQDSNALLASRAREFALSPDTLEHWLLAVLEQWRASVPPEELEPWDFYFYNGVAARRLAAKIPLDRLRAVNDSFYQVLGAPPERLGINYDLVPRPGKDPVAFTDFGARTRFRDGRWLPAELWVFSSYQTGGFSNLAELLHETGHGIHIAAIRTRPGLADWPDSDTFTEALADLFANEAYEPRWQWRYLADSASTAESIRAKYGSTVMDIAWALFEVRMFRDPTLDPNQVWTELTRDYLRIRPHPELSWWAMRGQLIDAPGYLMNYAIGAMITEDLRGRVVELRGDFAAADASWYPWITERIYRFGLERSAQQVLGDFLGRPMSPEALLRDMRRMGGRTP